MSGAARGIGRATAAAFAAAGDRVALGDVDADGAHDAAAALGGRAVGARCDVRDPESFATFLDEAQARLGPLDVLVNNAGVQFVGPAWEEPPEHTRRQLDVNALGTITGTRLALERMRPRGRGHVVNVASGAGHVGLAFSATYSATKHAIVGFSEAVHLELADAPALHVSVVIPGIVATAMIAGERLPAGARVQRPEEVAATIVRVVARPRFKAWSDPRAHVLDRLLAAAPQPIRDAAVRRLGLDRDYGRAARADYEAGAAADRPGSGGRHQPPLAGSSGGVQFG